MANQGCPGEGPDHRTLGWIICPLQRWLSWHSSIHPLTVVLGFPPYVVLNIPVGRTKLLMIRFGWRYDTSWLGFLFPTGACKILDHPVLY